MANWLPNLSRIFRRAPQGNRTACPAKVVPTVESLEGRALPSSLSLGLAHAARHVHGTVRVRHTTPKAGPKISVESAARVRLERQGVGDSSPDKGLDKNGETARDGSVDRATDTPLDQSPDKSNDNTPNDSRP
jgi:hypothetical protein